MKKYHVFTDCDLDGVVSYLTFAWFHPDDEISCTTTTVTNFRSEYIKFLSKWDPSHFDKIFILDLDVGEHKDLIDTPNHFIIDHHKTHVDSGPYQHATAVVKEYTSACKLAYRLFDKITNIELSDNRKKLILLGDDYDSYTLQLPDSKNLNVLYWNTQNRFNVFIEDFYNGFRGFNIKQQNLIKQHLIKIEQIKRDLEIYHITKDVQGRNCKILSAFAHEAINDIADYLLDEKGADIAIVVNMNTNRVSFRRNVKIEDISLIEFGQEVCGDGGGHAYAAGGSISEKFINFSKTLTPYEHK